MLCLMCLLPYSAFVAVVSLSDALSLEVYHNVLLTRSRWFLYLSEVALLVAAQYIYIYIYIS